MANRFFTVMVVPEKTSKVYRLILPGWLIRGSVVGVLFVGILAGIMLLDYWYVMSQISENKQLKLENRRLRQQVQIFKNKMTTIESTMDRIRTFTTRLKVITNIEDRSINTSAVLPDASAITSSHAALAPPPAEEVDITDGTITTSSSAKAVGSSKTPTPEILSNTSAKVRGDTLVPGVFDLRDSIENSASRREYEELDQKFSKINYDSLLLEQNLQNQYELLSDQKTFLAALPTLKPAVGYFTSGFGVRRSPTGAGRVKIHEGLDIANHPGTQIRAPADAVVTFADTKPGYGLTLILDHGYGLETWYGHTRKILVTKGQKIHRGDTIALLGNSGRSTGPHVHYEVRINHYPVDPMSYILEDY
ncbi:M23 family metallopeptidase [bacterium]|jgi:murein DD-endopeptidase MepM/ murein hydrolase activator NlpD|nr:M23 family metallopeptidase [bacterium]